MAEEGYWDAFGTDADPGTYVFKRDARLAKKIQNDTGTGLSGITFPYRQIIPRARGVSYR